VFQDKIEFFWKEVKERKKRGMGTKGAKPSPKFILASWLWFYSKLCLNRKRRGMILDCIYSILTFTERSGVTTNYRVATYLINSNP
jgi:hypothetical protein